MKIDDYLAKHQQAPFHAVLEPLAADPARIRITPVSAAGCACKRSIVVDKDDIVDVEPTKRTLSCCGKLRRVVEVTLRDEAKISAREAVASLLGGSADAVGFPWEVFDDEEPDPADVCREEAKFQFKRCVNGCRNSADPAKCRKECREQLADELDVCSNV